MADYATGTKKDDEPDLKELREAFDYDTEQWRPIRDEGKTDIKFVSGDPWSDKDRKVREDAGRPCLSLDELGQYTNQLINDVRQHKRAIQVAPLGNGANDATARVRADLIRQIEYRSNAQIAYTTGFENTVQRSYGFWQIKARYESPRSHEQELYIDPFVNPDMVTPDSDLQKPDGSDMKRAFVHERWRIKDFKKRWPKAQVQSFSADLAKDAPSWIDEKTIQIAEYWSIEETERNLLLVQGPTGPVAVFFDELKPPAKDAPTESQQKWATKYQPLVGAAVIKHRAVQYPQVQMRLTNGFEFLTNDEGKTVTNWPGRYIPIVCCFGKVLYVNEGGGSKRRILSLVRLARDPYMLYCYYRTCEAELVGMTPKFPYFAYEGQLSDVQEAALGKSLHEPVALIKVKALVDDVPIGTGPLPFPQRQPYDPPIQALEVGAESARRAIQAAMGMSPLPTQAQRRNEKSGVALKTMEDSAQKGSLHFIDHYEMAITRTGVILDDLLDHYYDAARDVTLRDAAGETRVARINDPNVPDQEEQEPLMLGRGDHDITLSTGPSYDSERELASEFTDSIVQNIQAIAQMSGPQAAAKLFALAIKLKNVGPIGDEMAEIIAPQEQGSPEQLQAQLEQAKQVIQELQAALAEAKQIIDTDAVKADQQIKIAEAKANTDAQLKMAEFAAKMEGQLRDLEVKLEIELAKIGSAQALARGEQEMQQLHHHDEMALRAEELATADAQKTLDREAQKEQAEADRVAKNDTSGVSSGATD